VSQSTVARTRQAATTANHSAGIAGIADLEVTVSRNRSLEPMAVIGALVLITVLFLGLAGDLGASDDILAAQQEATAAAAAAPGNVPF
jgi:hypothetical protein